MIFSMRYGERDTRGKKMNKVRLFLSTGGILHYISGVYFITVQNIVAKIFGGICLIVGTVFLLSGLAPEYREESL